MKLKSLLFLAIISFLTACSSQKNAVVKTPLDALAPTNAENALLWEITGKGLKEPSYLYGTIHMIPKKDFIMTELIEEKFDACQQLALEIDMDNPSMFLSVFSGIFMKGGVKLEDLLTEEEYLRVSTYVKDSLGMPMKMVNKMKPILASTLFMERSMKGEDIVSYEGKFMEMAKENDFELVGLETAKYQISIFDSIPYKDQAQMLLQSLDAQQDGTSDDGATYVEMVELYKKQDLVGLHRMTIEQSPEMKKYDDILLNNRNRNWIPKIEELTKDRATFIAVGAAHLPGKYGVIALLRKQGYQLKALK